VGDLLTRRIATCCKPVPGRPIVGYITRGKGITVHRADCPNVVNLTDTERLIDVSWGKAQQAYPVTITSRRFDRSGLLRDIAAGGRSGHEHELGQRLHQQRPHGHHRGHGGHQERQPALAAHDKLQNVRDVLDVRREASA
jgi:(p)ppGpp synthase/HD superfamily hydrolase